MHCCGQRKRAATCLWMLQPAQPVALFQWKALLPLVAPQTPAALTRRRPWRRQASCSCRPISRTL